MATAQLPGQTPLAEHDPEMFALIEKVYLIKFSFFSSIFVLFFSYF
jgi:hypothetical protein